MDRLFSVITTIQPPTPSVIGLLEKLAKYSGVLVVAGDKKGPVDFQPHANNGDDEGGQNGYVQFLSLPRQLESPFELARKLPTGHYCRKNIGYLHAIAQGASCIYELDDDNAPLPCWKPRVEYLNSARVVRSGTSRWVNVYKYFSDQNIWPRGLPLDEIHTPVPIVMEQEEKEDNYDSSARAVPAFSPSLRGLCSPIQQGLVNGSPDVDAIWRLVQDRPFAFDNRPSVFLGPGNWCPFNTQSTWWWPVAYPLLYVPSFCSFRMCDIWKSFVAQRCLWEIGAGVAFHAPEVVQDRNHHDLMKDFRDEIPGYEQNKEFVKVLQCLNLKTGTHAVGVNLRSCYEALVNASFFPEQEIQLVNAWLGDYMNIAHGNDSNSITRNAVQPLNLV